MQTANALVAIDKNTLVPKYGLTAPEIAVLRAIHGPESVTEIEPAGTVDRSNAEELARLNDIYRGARDEDNQPILRGVYPVAGALHLNLSDLDLPDEVFKAKTRAKATDRPTAVAKASADTQAGQNSSPDDAEKDRQDAERQRQADAAKAAEDERQRQADAAKNAGKSAGKDAKPDAFA